jgi:hypothetical protein
VSSFDLAKGAASGRKGPQIDGKKVPWSMSCDHVDGSTARRLDGANARLTRIVIEHACRASIEPASFAEQFQTTPHTTHASAA